ncbi:MAG: asparagine synthase (glutamine-hydrolyzing) [Anaerolineae bacterium]|nr:asparagine synthase (glutamine-hydrolyzing) [Anaerolineae bacterium]
MCGIIGCIDLNGRDRVDPALTHAMAARIAHRGPDGDGFFDAPGVSLGMRRLSIIDVAGGDQPIFNEDRSVALVFNGEIYNYVELRETLIQQGHQFSTRADTETIVHLYEQHGLDLFRFLRGMYAFALWDARQQRLILAVDHIGIKPLYLAERDGQLLFGSEIKALLCDPALNAAPALETLDTYLSFGYMLGEQTLFQGIRRLMPGHYLVIDTQRGSQEMGRFWQWGGADVQSPQPVPDDPAAAVAMTRDLLRDAVRLHLRSDVPLGLFLSGGVDSASMLALMSEFVPGSVETYTVGYDLPTGDNELIQARRVATHFGATHHEHVIGAEDWWRHFLAYVYHNDEPVDNPAAVSLQALAEVTAQDVKVVLNGTGGDELFCGYESHAAWPRLLRTAGRLDRVMPATWRARLIGRPLGALEPWYPALKRYRVVGALPYYVPRWQIPFLPAEEALRRSASYEGYAMSDGLRRRLYAPVLQEAWQAARHKEHAYHAIWQAAHARSADPVDVAQALVALAWLPADALLVADKVTMAHSLELRVPFFDRPLLDFAIQLPADLKTRGNKWLLREAMRPYLPEWALQRPKQWFGSPVLDWFDGPLRDRTQAILRDQRSLERGLFDRAALTGLLDRHFSRRENHIQLVMRLLILELWQRAFVDGQGQE